MRTRMTEMKSNFKNKYGNLNCNNCEENNKHNEETQEHVYKCTEIKENKGNFEKIFSNAHETKTLKEVIKEFLTNMNQRKKTN